MATMTARLPPTACAEVQAKACAEAKEEAESARSRRLWPDETLAGPGVECKETHAEGARPEKQSRPFMLRFTRIGNARRWAMPRGPGRRS
jgi:hypothetical protein